MSTIINATTTNGVVIQPDNSGSLVLQTNSGTTALTINTSQHTTLAGKLITASSGIQFSDSSIQTAAASPFVLKNRIINGDMRIDQRNAGASVAITTSDNYITDRFYSGVAANSKLTGQQNAGSVTPPTGFVNYLGMNVAASANVTVGASETYFIAQNIEGLNTSDLAWGTANAATITLSFWVRSSLTGTFGGSLRNSAANRSYPFTYTITTANTWEQKSITITGDTSGTWLTTNGIGIRLIFGLGVGSSLSGTAGAWAAANYVSATGAVKLIETNSATWYITGVQLEIGTSATPFERRLYNQELANCQRYYWQKNSETSYAAFGSGTMNSATAARIYLDYPTTMRAIPTISATSVASFIVSQATDLSVSGLTAYPNSGGALVDFNTSTGTAGRGVVIVFNNTSSGSIQASAEL
jgi:hypothetical protein